MRTQGVECPECGGMFTKVQQSNLDIENNRVRARVCQDCDHLFSTVELVVPGLSFARTQRSRRHDARIVTPQYVSVRPNAASVTVFVVEPKVSDTCRRGHPWTPENTYIHPRRQTRTCRECRLINARERYHHARRKAPESIKAEQRAYWREAWRRRNAA